MSTITDYFKLISSRTRISPDCHIDLPRKERKKPCFVEKIPTMRQVPCASSVHVLLHGINRCLINVVLVPKPSSVNRIKKGRTINIHRTCHPTQRQIPRRLVFSRRGSPPTAARLSERAHPRAINVCFTKPGSLSPCSNAACSVGYDGCKCLTLPYFTLER